MFVDRVGTFVDGCSFPLSVARRLAIGRDGFLVVLSPFAALLMVESDDGVFSNTLVGIRKYKFNCFFVWRLTNTLN